MWISSILRTFVMEVFLTTVLERVDGDFMIRGFGSI
jgi:hypothetical protein